MTIFLASIWHWGSTNLGDWSNLLSPIEGLGAFGAGYVLYRRHNCHVHGCPRIGRHAVDGTPFVVCRHHHPDDSPSHADVLAAARDGAPRGNQ